MTNFVSVSTGAARYQDISLNPQKLAGQCAKLKCCLNFEVDSYVEASRKLPGKEIRLETADATYFYFKADIFKGEITYSTDKNVPANLVTLTAKRAWEIVAMNKNGEKPLALKEEADEEKPRSAYADILGQDSLTRFDKKKKKRRKDDARRDDKGQGEQRRNKADKAEKSGEKADRPQKPNQKSRADRGGASAPDKTQQPKPANDTERQRRKDDNRQPKGERRDKGRRGGSNDRPQRQPQQPDDDNRRQPPRKSDPNTGKDA